ncbi:MAG TPA: lycopene cyclase domain-containing protein [Chitinophagales bacterium]|nr:lycopene cyclase domain-containing protein [Chitinophagales bacterium]HNF67772.1 lycopene cyclase domain-containing protein [Chitinophagales bacterium]
MNQSYLYLLINTGTILFPFLFSFESRVRYVNWWKWLFPSMFITALVFLTWDQIFTVNGVWGFNDRYITGAHFMNLPIEEILFFFTVPYASIFIYAFTNTIWPDTPTLDKYANKISYAMLTIALILLVANYNKAYTALNCGYAVVLLCIQLFLVKGTYMGKFYRFYLWHLIPFFIVNGILTGWGIAEEVVWYNNHENLGIRMGTIPIEDSLYSFSLMLMNIMLIEGFKSRSKKKNALIGA